MAGALFIALVESCSRTPRAHLNTLIILRGEEDERRKKKAECFCSAMMSSSSSRGCRLRNRWCLFIGSFMNARFHDREGRGWLIAENNSRRDIIYAVQGKHQAGPEDAQWYRAQTLVLLGRKRLRRWGWLNGCGEGGFVVFFFLHSFIFLVAAVWNAGRGKTGGNPGGFLVWVDNAEPIDW